MSKDINKTIHAFVDGDRLEAKAIRESAEFQSGGFVHLGNGRIVSGRSQSGKSSSIGAGTSFDVIAAAVSKSGASGMDSIDSGLSHHAVESGWVMVASNGTEIAGASPVSVRIDEYASEMLKDPKKVREFFKRVNGEAPAG